MDKHSFNWHGKKYYLLGIGADGRKMYYEASSFDCGWYWGVGYVETFTNDKNPHLSKDIASHTHWDSLFEEAKKQGKYHDDAFNYIFKQSPFTEGEKWKIIELMRSLCTARSYSDMLHLGGAHVTSNPCMEIIKSDSEYDRINTVVIPAMLEALYAILEG